MERRTIKLSEMEVGDLAIYNDMVVKLRDGGRSGGCEHDLYLAYHASLTDYEGDLDDLPDIEVDCEDVSGLIQ